MTEVKIILSLYTVRKSGETIKTLQLLGYNLEPCVSEFYFSLQS